MPDNVPSCFEGKPQLYPFPSTSLGTNCYHSITFFFPSTRPARIQIKDPLPPLDTTLPSFISFPLSLISQRSAATRGSFLQFHQRGLWTFLPGPRGSDLINLFTTSGSYKFPNGQLIHEILANSSFHSFLLFSFFLDA